MAPSQGPFDQDGTIGADAPGAPHGEQLVEEKSRRQPALDRFAAFALQDERAVGPPLARTFARLIEPERLPVAVAHRQVFRHKLELVPK